MFYTYVLRSQRTGSYYVGYTADIAARLQLHNSGRIRATADGRPWVVFHTEEFTDEENAVRRERQLKSWKSRAAIERLKFGNKIEDPPRPRPSSAEGGRFRSRAGRGRNRDCRRDSS